MATRARSTVPLCRRASSPWWQENTGSTKLVLGLHSLCFIGALTAVAMPEWFTWEDETCLQRVEVRGGLWTICRYEVSTERCQDASHTHGQSIAAQVLMVMSLVIMCLGIALTTCSICRMFPRLAALTKWFLILTGLGGVLGITGSILLQAKDGEPLVNLRTGWCFYVSLGCHTLVIVVLLMACCLPRERVCSLKLVEQDPEDVNRPGLQPQGQAENAPTPEERLLSPSELDDNLPSPSGAGVNQPSSSGPGDQPSSSGPGGDQPPSSSES